MKKYEYTFTIIYINVLEGAVTVKYVPTNELLTAFTVKVPLVQDDSAEYIDIINVIKQFAPHNRWEAHEHLVENYNSLLNKTELVLIENA